MQGDEHKKPLELSFDDLSLTLFLKMGSNQTKSSQATVDLEMLKNKTPKLDRLNDL